MNVVLDFRKYDGVVGGVEQAVFHLVRNVTGRGNAVVLLCKRNRLEETRDLFHGTSNLDIVPLDVRNHVISRANRILDSTVIQDIAEQRGADLIHFPYNWSFPAGKKAPSVLTIHDVIPFTFREAQSLRNNRLHYRPSMRRSAALNDVIATVSEFSKQDIVSKLGVRPEKIRVIYNGLRDPNPPDPDQERNVRRSYGLAGRFVLNVGGIHERKNVPRLIRAFASLRRDHGYGGMLVITGRTGGAPYQERMKRRCDEAVRRAGLDGSVVFTDFVTESELDSLYRSADCLVYPSLYEGFGIPVLEAMKLDLPVVTSSTTALPEVAGDAALLVNPERVEEITEAMARIVSDQGLRRDLARRGRERAQGFTWETNAEAYLSVYEELAGS